MAADGETIDPNAGTDPGQTGPSAQGALDSAQGALNAATQFGNDYSPGLTSLAVDAGSLYKDTVTTDPQGARHDALVLRRGLPAADKAAARSVGRATTKAKSAAELAEKTRQEAQVAQQQHDKLTSDKAAAQQALQQAEAERAQALSQQQKIAEIEARVQAAEKKLHALPPEDPAAMASAEAELARAQAGAAKPTNARIPQQARSAQARQKAAQEALDKLKEEERLRVAARTEQQAANTELTAARASFDPKAAATAEAKVQAAHTKLSSLETGKALPAAEQRVVQTAETAQKAETIAAKLAGRASNVTKGAAVVSGEAGFMSKALRGTMGFARKLAWPVAIGAGIVEVYQGWKAGGVQGAKTAAMDVLGTSVGALAGAEAGAAIGTMIFPGVGTVVGGLVGSFAGGYLLSKPVQTAVYGVYHNGVNFARQVVHGNIGEAASSLWNGAGAVWNSLWGQQIINSGHAVVPPPAAAATQTVPGQPGAVQPTKPNASPTPVVPAASLDTPAEAAERLAAAQNGVAEFKFNSADLGQPEHAALLDADKKALLAKVHDPDFRAKLANMKAEVVIEGHYDSKGGQSSRNTSLAEMRAQAAGTVAEEARQALLADASVSEQDKAALKNMSVKTRGAGVGTGSDAQAQRAASLNIALAN